MVILKRRKVLNACQQKLYISIPDSSISNPAYVTGGKVYFAVVALGSSMDAQNTLAAVLETRGHRPISSSARIALVFADGVGMRRMVRTHHHNFDMLGNPASQN